MSRAEQVRARLETWKSPRRSALRRRGPLRLEGLEARQLLAANVIISEIVASNASGLLDNYGDQSDWVELYNAGDEAADLTGWHLTDDDAVLDKWTFPAKSLAPNERLVVFASGRDVVSPNGEFHTNFSLSAAGEYLGLIKADGTTVAHQFSPKYPAQFTNLSFGVPHPFESTVLLAAEAPVKTLVPSTTNGGSTLGDAWKQRAFDDAAWAGGVTGVGFERGAGYENLIGADVGADMYSKRSSVFIRIPFDYDSTALFSKLTLRMKYDDGFVAYLNGELIAQKNDPAQLAWDSGATIQNLDTRAIVFEDFDVTAFRTALQQGENVLAIQGLNLGTGSSDFLILPELVGIIPDELDINVRNFFAAPSPGEPNGEGAPSVAPQATYSVPGGVYNDPVTLTLSTGVPGAVIYYTTNGAVPTTSSSVYASPLNITNSTIVKSLVVAPNMLPNHVATQHYTRLGNDVRGFDSDLPIVVVDTFGRPLNDVTMTEVFATFVDVDGTTGRAEMTGPLNFAGRAGLRIRGSSSTGFAKQQYVFETWDALGNDLDATILDFPTESDYILYAPYSEKSLMQNALAYKWSNDIGQWAVKTRFVEVYLNTNGGQINNNDYWGVYIFMERIKRGDERLDVAKLDPSQNTAPEITGGYVLKKDRLDADESPFSTSRGHQLGFVEPDGVDVTPEQKAWIRQYMNDFEAALYGPNFRDPVNGYRKYIDIDSFIDHHLLVELTKNIDGYRLSTFMYKDRGGKLNMGPIWDYNLSLGNADYLNGGIPQGWYYPQLGAGDYPWYGRLFEDPDFRQSYIDRWAELRRDQFSTEKLVGDIEAYKSELQESQVRNFQRWQILGTYVWPNYFVGPTWQSEIDFMTNWLRARLDWIDSQWINAPIFSSLGGEVGPGFQLTISADLRQLIYYTLDGVDPRLPGGAINPNALSATEAVTLPVEQNTRVMARVYSSGSWGGLTEATFISAERPPLRITEIMYHPPAAPPGSAFDDEDFEFIELANISAAPLQLDGFTLGGGVEFAFTDYELAPGGRLVLVVNQAAFESRYGADLPVAGVYSGLLGNASDTLVLRGAFDETILDFAYLDDWYPTTDGEGYALTIVDAEADRLSWGAADSWKASASLLGSPGSGDRMLGDTNGDGQVDLVDLNNVRNNFGGQGLGDADGDSDVDLSDLNAVRNNFGASAGANLGAQRTVSRAVLNASSLSLDVAVGSARIEWRDERSMVAIGGTARAVRMSTKAAAVDAVLSRLDSPADDAFSMPHRNARFRPRFR